MDNIEPVTNLNNLQGKKILLRTCLNVPIKSGEVLDDFRIKESARTIAFLKKNGARVIAISHTSPDDGTLAVAHKRLNEIEEIKFIPSVTGEAAFAARKNLKDGEAILLENVRNKKGEKTLDVIFAEELVYEIDLFVFDDFSVAHREHTSVLLPIKYLPSYAGIRFYEEITALLRVTERLVKPSVVISAGAKVETKLPLLKKLLPKHDYVYIGGVMANVFLKARGYEIGKSKTEDIKIPNDMLHYPNLVLPKDVVVYDSSTAKSRSVLIENVGKNDMIVDLGPLSIITIENRIKESKTVLWNGPLGLYEKGFTVASLSLSETVGKSSSYSIVGGGDTVNLINSHNHQSYWQLVSTGGGSLLHYLTYETLPVLEYLKEFKVGK